MQLKFGYKDEGVKRKRFISKATGNIEDEYIENELRNTLLSAMATLSEREQMIIILHFGLYDGCAMSYSEIATRLTEMGYSISTSRVNQIGREALTKLANNRKWGKKLRSFLAA